MTTLVIRVAVRYLARVLPPNSCTHCGRPVLYCVCGRFQ